MGKEEEVIFLIAKLIMGNNYVRPQQWINAIANKVSRLVEASNYYMNNVHYL